MRRNAIGSFFGILLVQRTQARTIGPCRWLDTRLKSRHVEEQWVKQRQSPNYPVSSLFYLSLCSCFWLQRRANVQLWTRLRVGYPSPSASFFPLFATKEAGLLEKYGFDTEMVYVSAAHDLRSFYVPISRRFPTSMPRELKTR